MKSALRSAREQFTDLTQADVADAMGVTLSAYQKWEQGQRMMKAREIKELAKLFGVTTDTILGTKYSELEMSEECEVLTSKDEIELITCFRGLDNTAKKAVMDFVRTMSSGFAD